MTSSQICVKYCKKKIKKDFLKQEQNTTNTYKYYHILHVEKLLNFASLYCDKTIIKGRTLDWNPFYSLEKKLLPLGT